MIRASYLSAIVTAHFFLWASALFAALPNPSGRESGLSKPQAASQFIQSICTTFLTNSHSGLIPLVAKHSTKNLPIYTKDEIWDHKFRSDTDENHLYNEGLEELIDVLEEENLFGRWVTIFDEQGNHLLAGLPEKIESNKYDDTPIGIRWHSPLHFSLVVDNDVPTGYNTMNSIYAVFRTHGAHRLQIKSFNDRYLLIQVVLERIIAQQKKMLSHCQQRMNTEFFVQFCKFAHSMGKKPRYLAKLNLTAKTDSFVSSLKMRRILLKLCHLLRSKLFMYTNYLPTGGLK